MHVLHINVHILRNRPGKPIVKLAINIAPIGSVAERILWGDAFDIRVFL